MGTAPQSVGSARSVYDGVREHPRRRTHPGCQPWPVCSRVCIMAPDKPHDDVWKYLLEHKGLAAAASVLEEYGLSCEADVSRLDEEDLGALTSKLKPLQSNLLRKWVQGLAPGCDRGTILSDVGCCAILAHQARLFQNAGRQGVCSHGCGASY